MLTEPKQAPRLDTAHVLFLDIVGYSRLEMDQQLRYFRELNDLVKGTPEFRQAEGAGNLICLPTGDGMALVFFRDPALPAQCAMRVSSGLKEYPGLEVRMGLHSGPVYLVNDINQQTNVSGGGINLAQRVMDCGESGHILLTSQFRDQLVQIGSWPLVDLGECEIKHGDRLRLFNLCTDNLGNRRVPAKLHSGTQAAGKQKGATRIALLYKRNAEPDQTLLWLIESHLKGLGCEVFIDRHLAVGVEWAREINAQIRGANAVIPLISEISLQSEMLAEELTWANDAAQKTGRPRILPVRINYEGPLPETMAAILDPIEYALWEGENDTPRLLENLSRAIDSLGTPLAPVPVSKLEPVGGAVPLDSTYYVDREEDRLFQAALERQDSIILIKGARQMGKTSLMARGLQQARANQSAVILTDMRKLNAEQLESTESLFLALGEWLADQLDLDVLPDEVWNARRGPSVNFERYIRREVLQKLERPIVWAMDEVDRLFDRPYASEVFGLFRSWHNERSLDPSGPWSRLTLVIAYATEAHLIITDINQSPFNVGTRLELTDFSYSQIQEMNRRYRSPLRDDAQLNRFYRLTNGHPFLVRRGLNEMVARSMDINTLEATAGTDEGVYGDHLRRLLVLLARSPELVDATREVIAGRPCPTQQAFYRLRSAGVLSGDSSNTATMRCQVYAQYVARHLNSAGA